jgi:predicted metal-dependent HD superfamily phosphohydrolase
MFAAQSSTTDLERWRELWKGLNCKTNADEVFNVLATYYSQPHRAYHTLDHIRCCLNEFENVRHLAVRGKEIELAIWFHDAIYKPVAKDNEERSARLAEQFLLEAEVPATVVERVSKLILATKHDAIPGEPDARLLVDIDLSTLGAPEEIFDEYEKHIRFEYKHVPWLFYKKKRVALLDRKTCCTSPFSAPAGPIQAWTPPRCRISAPASRLPKSARLIAA